MQCESFQLFFPARPLSAILYTSICPQHLMLHRLIRPHTQPWTFHPLSEPGRQLSAPAAVQLNVRRRCRRSRKEVRWPRCNCSKEPYREGLSRLDFCRRCCRRCCRSRTKVVCREGERRWCAVEANEGGENSACAACAVNSSLRGKPEDATARECASKKEHPTVKW
jgi:hypothetical protein